MTSKKRKLITLTSLAVGICIFTAAAVANLATAGGYAVYKNALIGLAGGTDNYTMQVEMAGAMDDKVLARMEIYEMYSAADNSLYSEVKEYWHGDNENDYELIQYIQDGRRIAQSKDSDGWRTPSISDESFNSVWFSTLGNASIDLENEEQQKLLRFVELLADTLMGDLKNNFVYTAGDENSKTYALMLDGMQVPEFVNAGLSLMFSPRYVGGEYDEDDPMSFLGEEPVVKSASTVFSVDNEGRLLHNDLYAELAGQDKNGETHTLSFSFSIDLSDYGTTVPKQYDPHSLDNEFQVDKLRTVAEKSAEAAEVTEIK